MKVLGVILLIVGIILAVLQAVAGNYSGTFWLGAVLVVLGIIFWSMGGKKSAGV